MASTRNLMKFTDIVRDHYRGPAYGQEFTTWYTKVQHGFSTAQVPESAQVDHLVAVLDSPAQELAFSFIKKYNTPRRHAPRGVRPPSAPRRGHVDVLTASSRAPCRPGAGAHLISIISSYTEEVPSPKF